MTLTSESKGINISLLFIGSKINDLKKSVEMPLAIKQLNKMAIFFLSIFK